MTEISHAPIEGEIVCGARLAKCVCTVVDEHTAHVCPCGGSWSGVDGPDLEILLFPGGVTEAEAWAQVFGGLLP